MSRLLALLVCCVAVAQLLVDTSTANAKGPNVLFVMADDLRPEMGSYGSIAKTPHLDRLAARSVQFSHAYCQQAVCNPSRSSMLTGLRPDTLGLWCNGIHFRELRPEVTTLPLWMKEHGYTTRCVGKIFHNWHTTDKGDRRSWSADEFLHYANHGEDKPVVLGDLPRDFATAPRCECRDVPDEAYYDGRVAAEAIRVLGEVKSQPFFLAVGLWKPHAPFNAPKRYWDLYQREQIPPVDTPCPANVPEVALHDSREIRGAPPKQLDFTPAQVAEMRHGYFANISYMDAQLGKVLAELERLKLDQNTLIVFAGDHGYHIGEHGLWGKTSNFELDARVPLMIALPGMRHAGEVAAAPVELLDLFPTVVQACQVPSPSGLEGKSLLPLLSDPKASIKPAAFSQHPRPAYYDREPSRRPQSMGVSVRTARVRYTEWRDWTTGEVIAKELYDAQHDPRETTNVADQSALADVQREAAALLRAQFPATPHPVAGK